MISAIAMLLAGGAGSRLNRMGIIIDKNVVMETGADSGLGDQS